MRISRPLATLAIASLLTGTAACAGAPNENTKASGEEGYPVKVETCGFTSTLEAKPAHAVTISQGATEVALALGAEHQLAGTAYLDDEIPET